MKNISQSTNNDYWTDQHEEDHHEEDEHGEISDIIWKVIPPFVIFFGIVGNVQNLKTFTSKKLRCMDCRPFLIVLSVIDVCVMCNLMKLWLLETFHLDVRTLAYMLCKLDILIMSSSGNLSSWLLTTAIADVGSFICFPNVAKYVTEKHRIWCILVISVIVFGLNVHFAVGFKLIGVDDHTECVLQGSDDYVTFIVEQWSIIEIVTNKGFPLVILIFFESSVIFKISNAYRLKRIHVAQIQPIKKEEMADKVNEPISAWTSQSTPDERCRVLVKSKCGNPTIPKITLSIDMETDISNTSVSYANVVRGRMHIKATRELTALLLALSTLTIVAIAPVLCEYFFDDPVWNSIFLGIDHGQHDHSVLFTTAIIMPYINSSVHFIVYYLSYPPFRKFLNAP